MSDGSGRKPTQAEIALRYLAGPLEFIELGLYLFLLPVLVLIGIGVGIGLGIGWFIWG